MSSRTGFNIVVDKDEKNFGVAKWTVCNSLFMFDEIISPFNLFIFVFIMNCLVIIIVNHYYYYLII
jgi:hypothetical protein